MAEADRKNEPSAPREAAPPPPPLDADVESVYKAVEQGLHDQAAHFNAGGALDGYTSLAPPAPPVPTPDSELERLYEAIERRMPHADPAAPLSDDMERIRFRAQRAWPADGGGGAGGSDGGDQAPPAAGFGTGSAPDPGADATTHPTTGSDVTHTTTAEPAWTFGRGPDDPHPHTDWFPIDGLRLGVETTYTHVDDGLLGPAVRAQREWGDGGHGTNTPPTDTPHLPPVDAAPPAVGSAEPAPAIPAHVDPPPMDAAAPIHADPVPVDPTPAPPVDSGGGYSPEPPFDPSGAFHTDNQAPFMC